MKKIVCFSPRLAAFPPARDLGLRAALGILLLAPSLAAAPLVSDTLTPGVSAQTPRAVGENDGYATLPNGDRVVFDGNVMSLVADDGTLITPLGSIARFGFPSFVLPDPTSTYALIGESSTGKIRKVDLAGGGAPVLAQLGYNYDAVFEDAGHALISAAPCGFSCGSEIYRLDVQTGALTLVASLTGPSGPLALSANGDLFYGSNSDTFPPPPCPILHWTKAQLDGGTLLHVADATTFVPGIQPASAMAFDPVYGHLFVASPVFGGTSQVLEYAPSGQLAATVVQSPEYLSGIELVRTNGDGSFQAFQPPGVLLKYRGTDFFGNTSEIRTLRPRRPRAWTSGPGLSGPGAVTFHVSGAYPNASLVVMVGLSSTYDPHEATIDEGTYLLHTGIDLAHVRSLTTLATDGNGEATYTFQNPGGLGGTRVFQAWIRDASGFFVGASTSAFN